MKVLSKKSVPYLRALREQIETEQRRDKFNKMMGHKEGVNVLRDNE